MHMEKGAEKRISKKQLKRNFNTIGLFLIIYVLLVLFIPFALNLLFEEIDSIIIHDDYLYYGIYFIFVLFGTLLPFFLMRKFSKIKFRKFNNSVKATFVDLFVQTIVFFTACSALIFVSNIIIARFGLDEKLLSSIGFSYEKGNLNNALYVFLLLIVTPLMEEYAFRGVLLNTLSKYGKKFALIASAVIFALAHVNFAEMIPAFVMGILLGKTSLRYKSVKPTILIHILFNLFMYLLCTMPISISMYMGYGLLAICILAIYFIISGKYERINVQTTKTYLTTNRIFYTRPIILFVLILLIINTVLFTFAI